MARYQIIYTKNQPITAWKATKEEAIKLADELKKQGYHVSVYEHTNNGATIKEAIPSCTKLSTP